MFNSKQERNDLDDYMTRLEVNNASLHTGLSKNEIRRYSIQKAIQAHLTGDWSDAGLERAASEATAKIMGQTPEGILIPAEVGWRHRVGRAFDVTTPTNAGNLVQTENRVSALGDALRPNVVFGQLGADFQLTKGDNLEIPRLTATTASDAALETATVVATQPTTGQLVFGAHRLFAQVRATKMGILQVPEMGALLERDMIASIASRLEYLGINGNGAAPQPTGILNVAGLGSVVGGTNGAQIAWSHLVDLEAACALLNAEPTLQGGYIVNSKSRQWMKKNVRGTYLSFIWGGANPEFPLNDRRAGVTTNCPSNGTKGTSNGVCSSIIYGADWSQLVVGLLGALDILVDPATFADKGEVRINMTQLFDVQIRQPAGFALMTDALTA